MTFDLQKKVTSDLKITDQVLMQCHMVMYRTCFCKSNKSGHI